MLNKMHTRSGSNGATEPVLISPCLQPWLPRWSSSSALGRPDRLFLISMLPGVTHTYALRTDYPCFYPDVCLPLKALGDLLRESFNSQDVSHCPDLAGQHCCIGKAFTWSFDCFGSWAGLCLTKLVGRTNHEYVFCRPLLYTSSCRTIWKQTKTACVFPELGIDTMLLAGWSKVATHWGK